MALVLDISTSMEFWRQIYPANRVPKSPAPTVPLTAADSSSEVSALSPPWAAGRFLDPLGGRLHTLVFNADSRRRSSSHVPHVWGGPIPDGSFYDLGNEVFVAAPEFIFLVAASFLGNASLVALGCELCGLYAFDQAAKRGFRKRTAPLSTIDRLQHYLSDAEGCRGRAPALAALKHVVENSASPMETFDVLALCLPYRLGGYNLPKPAMNYEVPLSDRAARIGRRRRCFADMCYVAARLDIEHHGRLDHSSAEDEASDRARVNALKEMGYEVIKLTKDQVNDLLAFEYIVQRIARLVGKRIDKQKLGATSARLALRKELFNWNRSSGQLRKV